MTKMIKVARMPQTIQYDGKTYGPSEKPIRIPEDLAIALGLASVDGTTAAAAEPDDAQGEELRAARTLAEQAQGNLSRLVGQLAPLAQEGEMPDGVLARLIAEREQNLRSLTQAQQDLESKSREAKHAVEQWTKTTEEFNAFRDAANAAGAEGTNERVRLETELRDARARVTELEAQPLLPPDALKRIEGVKGVGDKLAPVILDALTAPPAKE